MTASRVIVSVGILVVSEGVWSAEPGTPAVYVTLAEAHDLAAFPDGIDPSDPDPDWSRAQAVAEALRGEAINSEPPTYSPGEKGRIW